MANIIDFNVTYTQDDSGSENGIIILNTEEKTASGRLDVVGDFVSADGFKVAGYTITVECSRISNAAMRIRLVFWASVDSYYQDSSYDQGSYDGESVPYLEKILDPVPIDFE